VLLPGGGAWTTTEDALTGNLDCLLSDLIAAHERAQFRKATDAARKIWSLANAYLAKEAPWAAIGSRPHRAALVTRVGVNLLNCAAVVAWPFIPDSADIVLASLQQSGDVPHLDVDARSALRAIEAGRELASPPILFPKLGIETAGRLRERYG
jgi:methionyl-tRNA synthetase